jgi:hypothetical protein
MLDCITFVWKATERGERHPKRKWWSLKSWTCEKQKVKAKRTVEREMFPTPPLRNLTKTHVYHNLVIPFEHFEGPKSLDESRSKPRITVALKFEMRPSCAISSPKYTCHLPCPVLCSARESSPGNEIRKHRDVTLCHTRVAQWCRRECK